MLKVKEAIIVEGKYDKIKLSSLVDGVILETGGFGIFKDKERMELIRRLADKQGILVLTDSDGAGFLIRHKLSSCIAPEKIKHAYIPDLFGKERRKAAPSKEGKLGVEGMSAQILKKALINAGATVGESTREEPEEKLNKGDMYDLGLAGGTDSARKRRTVQKALGLPERLSANGLMQAAGALYGKEEFARRVKEILTQEEQNGADQKGS